MLELLHQLYDLIGRHIFTSKLNMELCHAKFLYKLLHLPRTMPFYDYNVIIKSMLANYTFWFLPQLELIHMQLYL